MSILIESTNKTLIVFCFLAFTVINDAIFTCQTYQVSPPVTNLCQFYFINDATCSYSQFSQCRYHSKCIQFQDPTCTKYEIAEDRNVTSCLLKCCASLQKENELLYNSFDCETLQSGDDSLDPLFHVVNIQMLVAALTIVCFLTLLTLFIKKCARPIKRQSRNEDNQNPKTERPLNELPAFHQPQWVQSEPIPIKFSEQACSICLICFPNCQTKCKHRFHFACISEWIEIKDSCPLCKAYSNRAFTIYCKRCYRYSYQYKFGEKMMNQQICNKCKE